MDDVLRGRSNPNLPVDELRSALQTVTGAFGAGWLLGKETHPLRSLWARDDALATCELFWLGDALYKMRVIDENWTKWHVKRIKRGNKNERTGSIFEILALGMFCLPDQTIEPAGRSAKGYDASIIVTGARACLSIKNLGASDYQRLVEIKSREIHNLIMSEMRKLSRVWFGITAIGRFYPTEEDWKALRTGVLKLLNELIVVPSAINLNSQWTLFINVPPKDHLPLDPTQPSHTVQVFVPHHAKERRTFLNRISREVREFHRHVADSNVDEINRILIRIPESAAISECSTWLSNDLETASVGGVDQIFLYQPAVSVNRDTDTTQIAHHLSMIQLTKRDCGHIGLSMPVGIISKSPIRNILQMGDEQLPLDGHHSYQGGSVYQIFSVNPEGETRARLRSIAPGIATRAVLRSNDGSGMTLSGKFAPSAELSLFS